MKLGRIKKFGVGLVAAATMAGGAALAAPAVAMAAAPTVAVEQDVSDLTVTTEDVNTSGTNVCLPILVSGETALQVGVAYATGDWSRIGELLASGGDNVKFGAAASGNSFPVVGQPLPNPSVTEWTPANGVYLLMGTCAQVSLDNIWDVISGDFSSVLGNIAENTTFQPVIVPNGIGSIEPAADFGSMALQAGSAIIGDQIGG